MSDKVADTINAIQGSYCIHKRENIFPGLFQDKYYFFPGQILRVYIHTRSRYNNFNGSVLI